MALVHLEGRLYNMALIQLKGRFHNMALVHAKKIIQYGTGSCSSEKVFVWH